MFNLIILSLFTLATCEPVWETIALSDCNGGMSLLPSSPVSFFKKIIPPYHISKKQYSKSQNPKTNNKNNPKTSLSTNANQAPRCTYHHYTYQMFFFDRQTTFLFFFDPTTFSFFFLNRWPFTSMDLKVPT